MEKEHPWIQKEQAEGGRVYMEERRIEVSGYLEGQGLSKWVNNGDN